MGLAVDHTYAYTGAEIAEAASRRADELEAEIPTGEVEDARAALQAEIGKAIERMLLEANPHFDYGEAFRALVREGSLAHENETISLSSSQDRRDDRSVVVIDGAFRRRLILAISAVDEKRRAIAALRTAAVRYTTQATREYELDAGDVAKFGLDRERPAA